MHKSGQLIYTSVTVRDNLSITMYHGPNRGWSVETSTPIGASPLSDDDKTQIKKLATAEAKRLDEFNGYPIDTRIQYPW